jgi:ATP phosphoribosyltransferase
MLKLVIPKGSLEKATLELFKEADLEVKRASDIDYRANIEDERISEVRILRPQEIPIYVAEGLFDLGITGQDWIEETSAHVETVGELSYSKNTSNPIRMVLAVAQDNPAQKVQDLKNKIRVSTEYPNITSRFLKDHGVDAEVFVSYGATEAKVPEIADAVVEITETGRALKAAGLKIIAELMVSTTKLIANPESFKDLQKRHLMNQIFTLLDGTLRARERVLVKLNVEKDKLEKILAMLPALKSPTVSELALSEGFAVETVVEKRYINKLIPSLKDLGATDILEIPLSKIIL